MQYISQQTITIEVDVEDTIENVREKIRDKIGIDEERKKIVFVSKDNDMVRELIFGDGSDGDCVIDDTVELTRHMFYNNLTIKQGGVLKNNGYVIVVKGNLHNDGCIDNSGENGGDASIVTAGVGGRNGAGLRLPCEKLKKVMRGAIAAGMSTDSMIGMYVLAWLCDDNMEIIMDPIKCKWKVVNKNE